MKWKGRRSSSNVQDARAQRVSGGRSGAGLGALLQLVQVYAINTEAFHFMVNRACDDITWGKLRAFIETGHKPIPVRQQ